jgi:hypothetical protein
LSQLLLFDHPVLNCRNHNSSGARGFSIFDFAPGFALVASRCWRGVCNLIEIEKLSFVRHKSFLLFARSATNVGVSRLGCEVERTEFDVHRSPFDRCWAGFRAKAAFLDFWSTLREHDSLFQKSPILAPSGGDRLCKKRRLCKVLIPKVLEFAPDGQSSKNQLVGSRGWLSKVGPPTFVAFVKSRRLLRR